MKYYSEITKKFYPTEDEALNAEIEYATEAKRREEESAKKAEQQKIEEDAVNAAFDDYKQTIALANEKYRYATELRDAYLKTYGNKFACRNDISSIVNTFFQNF